MLGRTRSQIVSVTQYNNAPLPDFLAASALVPDDALRYLEWCQQQGFSSITYEVWLPTEGGPTVLVGYVGGGDIETCVEAIRAGQYTLADKHHNPDVVYNFWVHEAEPSAV
jgi:uncharacterized protein CbrC (UPF0167 family)